MFSWFVSLLLLFGYGGRGYSVPLTGPSDHGNRHASPADNPYPNPSEPPDSDGQGSGGGGGGTGG